jgi:hypothetical protein
VLKVLVTFTVIECCDQAVSTPALYLKSPRTDSHSESHISS